MRGKIAKQGRNPQTRADMFSWREWYARRDEIIVRAALDGWSANQIGVIMGLSHGTVDRVLTKAKLVHEQRYVREA